MATNSVKFSELNTVPALDGDDIFALSAKDTTQTPPVYVSYKTTLNALATKTVSGTTINNLKTTSKYVDGAINETISNLAEDYSSSSTYAVGDCVLYAGGLYQCTTAITVAEAWDSTHWTAVKAVDVGSGGGGGSSTLAGLTDVSISSPSNGQILGYNSTSGKWENTAGGSGSGGHTIVNDGGTSLTQRTNLQFKGAYSEDNSTDNTTEVNVVREMTKAEFDLLSTNEKVGLINITDEIGGGLKYVKTTLWENIDESDITTISSGSTINLSDNILDYDEIYFESAFFEVNNATGKKLTHLAVTKMLKETINLAKSKYGTGQYEGMFDVCHNFISASGIYASMYCLKVPTDSSLYVAYKYVGGWQANLCTMTRIIGIKYLSDSENTYSTDEQIVGKWVDGSTIYEKTLNPSVSIGQHTYSHGISNYGKAIRVTGICKYNGGSSSLQLPYSSPSAGYDISIGNVTSTDFQLIVGSSFSTIDDCWVTIQYIKSSS